MRSGDSNHILMDRLMLNCDLGEDEPLEQTVRLLAHVDAANIGCGFHAGNPEKTRTTIESALEAGVLIGAHPGLAANGGRGGSWPSADAFRELLETQINTFLEAAESLGSRMDYIKLHGTLYHAVETDEVLADTYMDFLMSQPSMPAVFAKAGGRFARSAGLRGLRVYHEAFADRGYRPDGSLVPRAEDGAVLAETDALLRFRQWSEKGSMPTIDGGEIRLKADTLCVHGDSPGALELIRALRGVLRDSET